MGRQTPSTFPWIKKEEADSHFTPRKWGWKAWIGRHLLGIVVIYAYILWNFPQFAPDFDLWLRKIRLVVSQHGVDIVVWLCLLSYRYRIRFSYWQMTIRPLTLTWQTEVAVLVEFAAKMEHPLPFASFASTIGAELSYWILHDIHQFSYLVAYRRTRRFFPYLPLTLKHQILSSLKSVAAQGRTVPFRNLPRRVKRLDFVHVPDLNDLFQKLVLLNPQGRFAFAVLYRFAKVDRIITGEMLTATRQVNHIPLVRIQCCLWASERATRNQLKGLISGVTESRAWVWPKLHLFQPELFPLPFPPFLPQSARASQGHKGTQVGYVKLKNTKVAPYRLEPEDLYHGGVIAGAIGMGKTTLRLALTDLLLRHDVRIIDFDPKGDTARSLHFRQFGTPLKPGVNFVHNLFSKPANVSSHDFTSFLYNLLLDVIGPDVTPPQQKLLFEAIDRVVALNGNCLDFLREITFLGIQQGQRRKGFQRQTAQALEAKFAWMHGPLRDVFWTEESDLTESLFQKSVFFDLSKLYSLVPLPLIRLFINLVVFYINFSNLAQQQGKVCITLDEAQLFMPRTHGDLSRLEQSIVTLREAGVFVIASGVDTALMSRVLLDVGFVAQFRSGSRELRSVLEAQETDYQDLQRHECLVRRLLKDEQLLKIETIPFEDEKEPRLMTVRSASLLPPFQTEDRFVRLCELLVRIPELEGYSWTELSRRLQKHGRLFDGVAESPSLLESQSPIDQHLLLAAKLSELPIREALPLLGTKSLRMLKGEPIEIRLDQFEEQNEDKNDIGPDQLGKLIGIDDLFKELKEDNLNDSFEQKERKPDKFEEMKPLQETPHKFHKGANKSWRTLRSTGYRHMFVLCKFKKASLYFRKCQNLIGQDEKQKAIIDLLLVESLVLAGQLTQAKEEAYRQYQSNPKNAVASHQFLMLSYLLNEFEHVPKVLKDLYKLNQDAAQALLPLFPVSIRQEFRTLNNKLENI